MIGIIWTFLTGNKIARTIGMVVMAVLGVLTFGAVKKREGAQGAKAKRDVADAKETIKAHEVRDDVEDRIDRGGSAKQRLRERWRKP
jgi:hypothetical protein